MLAPHYTSGAMSDYRKALVSAERELTDVNAQIVQLQRRSAQLESTIAGLKSLMGETPGVDERSLTELIRTVLKGNSRFMGVDQVAINVRLLGGQLPSGTASVATILNRLVKSGEVEQGLTDTNYVAYKWKEFTPKLGYNRLPGRDKK